LINTVERLIKEKNPGSSARGVQQLIQSHDTGAEYNKLPNAVRDEVQDVSEISARCNIISLQEVFIVELAENNIYGNTSGATTPWHIVARAQFCHRS